MLTPADLVHIPYTPDLTEAGNLYACRCLALGRVQASNLDLAPLRHLSAEIAADLSLRRYLAQEDITAKLLDTEPFTHPDRKEVVLGGRPCHVINALIRRKSYIDRIKGNPAKLLSTPASAPEAALGSERWGYQDLMIFAFTLATPRLDRGVHGKTQAEAKTDFLIHIFPVSWRKTRLVGASSDLVVRSACDSEIVIELGGQRADRDFERQELNLPSGQSEIPVQGFATLTYISTRQAPTATISIHNPRYNHRLLITPDRWGSLWVDGIEIILAGYIEVGEFRRRALHLRPSDHPREFDTNASPSLFIPIQELLPLPGLIAWLHGIQRSS